MTVIARAIAQTAKALEENPNAKWIIGFSGGKDSTALLKIFASAISEARRHPKEINVIYCDTGVENPALDQYVKSLFRRLQSEFIADKLPFRAKLLKAPAKDRFFVKIIGRGYPPPTNSFRWCTNNLRIRPVAHFIKAAAAEEAVVALGMRRAESRQRDRSLERAGGKIWQNQIEGGRRYRLFLPVLDFDVEDVWDAVFSLPEPRAIEADALATLYRGASGECPIIKAPDAPPCATGRFGCWTCTVVRKDRSAESLIESGRRDLLPYLQFRNWLIAIRNDPKRRWPHRRKGTAGLGPFSLAARREIFRRLERLEAVVGKPLLPKEERREIENLWTLDIDIDKSAMRKRLEQPSVSSGRVRR